jgi:light-regulated signal transduction histidine kinase (bacteriophytochrome)
VSVDVRGCDLEPIHIPGAIQPHGVLVALDPRTRTVLQISANCAAYFGAAPEVALGDSLEALVGPAAHALAATANAASSASEPVVVGIAGHMFDVLGHRHGGVVILEFERQVAHASWSESALRATLARLQRPNSVGELCVIAVDAIRKLTGFDRVMMYRFNEDGHGDVIEESASDEVASYRGLRFPESDIPRQARELYVLNWMRLIPDAAYVPVPLLAAPERHVEPLDLSFATLRSVSPVHLEYLRNMDVGASMSVSLVESNRLWGLIACHHRTPRHVSFAARAACEVIGRIVALQIAAHEQLSIRTARDALRGIEARLVDGMRGRQADLATALVQRGDALMQLVGAAGAAVCTAGEIRTVGATPTSVQLGALVSWLGEHGTGAILHSNALAELHPPARDYAHVASGLLVMMLPHATPSYVMWFRPEIVRAVSWAGEPNKLIAPQAGDGQLHPRHSFAAWTQVVRGTSLPWQIAELDAAEALRRRTIEADLTNQIANAERAVLLRDEMVAVVSHDLKSPLQVIEMACALLQTEVDMEPRTATTVARIHRAVARMNTLIHDLLDLAKIESGRFEVVPVPCTVATLVSDSFAMLAPLAEAKGVQLVWTGDGQLLTDADPERVFQVLSNLVGNAIKFTPAGGVVTIEVHSLDGEVQFAVRDTGPGISSIELAHVFDRYWQARRARSAGSGLGLYIAKGIIEAHGKRIWAESAHGAGATFHFALPAHDPIASDSSHSTS